MLVQSIVKTTFISILFVICAWGELVFNNLREKLALDLLKLLPEKNLVASSVMVRFPLCKLASVATGEAKKELMTVLGYTNDTWMLGCYARFRELISIMAKTDLTYTNNIFIKYTDDVDPAFVVNSVLNFGVSVEKVGFDYPRRAVQFINRVVSTKTLKRVTDVLDFNDVNQNTSMVIVNAIYFKGTWESPFNYKLTKQEIFHYASAKVAQVPMMQLLDTIPYIDAGEFQAIKIRFGTSYTSVTFMLPFDKKGLPDLVDRMHADPYYFKPFFDLMKPKNMRLKMPRFNIKTYVDWSGFLQELGLYTIFNCTSSGLVNILKEDWRENSTICLSKVKQKVFLQVDEMGVARHILRQDHQLNRPEMPPDAPLIDATELIFNRPFFFTINLEFTRNNRHELLTGVYYGPE